MKPPRRMFTWPWARQRIVLSHRTDGLGQRLFTLLNAIRMADLLGVDFKLTWPLEPGVVADTTHAVVPAAEFFSAEFLAEHLIDDAKAERGFALPEGRGGLPELQEQLSHSKRGLMAHNTPLRRILDPKAVPEVNRGFAAEFARIGFHPDIQRAMDAALGVDLVPGAVGLHLRAGDNVFGKFRIVHRFWNKAIPAPIARELMTRFKAEGRDVVVFGQDADLITQLCTSTGAVDAVTMRPPDLGDRTAEAMFDLILLSRCDRIIGGSSGYARQAAAIAGIPLEYHYNLIEPDEALEITETDLRLNGDLYHPIQRAFARWVAYYRVRDDISYDDAFDLLSTALEEDPGNPRTRLRLAALSYREGLRERGDDILVDALLADVAIARKKLPSVMLFSRMTPKGFDSKETFKDIRSAAQAGPGPASVYRAALRTFRGKTKGAKADVDAFRSFAAGHPRLADVPDLDARVEATIQDRLQKPVE